jgi:hypothetical protein
MAYSLGMEPSDVGSEQARGGGAAAFLGSVQFVPGVDAIAGYSAKCLSFVGNCRRWGVCFLGS